MLDNVNKVVAIEVLEQYGPNLYGFNERFNSVKMIIAEMIIVTS